MYIQPPDPVSGRFFRLHLSIALQLSIPRPWSNLSLESRRNIGYDRSFKIFTSWRNILHDCYGFQDGIN